MSDGTDLTRLDATAQADLVRRGEVSPLELVDAAIAQAEAVNPTLNAIIHPRFERAREEAKTARPGEAPFSGVPMVVKDLGCAIGGEPHHGGTRALRDIGYLAPHDSALYRRFRAAGLIAIGRTNTPEWGSTITTEPVAYGPTRNPWNTEHSTGGSSGGSAASVAAGIVPIGHANDGGGSIRIPASECGLVGLKPSRGRVSQGPDVGESWMGATIDGVVTRSVRDTAAVLDLIAGAEPGDPYTAPLFVRPLADEVGADPGSLRIGVLDAPLIPGVAAHPECTAAVAHTAALLESFGHRVEVSWPDAIGDIEFPQRYTSIVAACTAADLDALERLLGRSATADDLEHSNLSLARIGREVSAAEYISAVAALHAWGRRVVSWWHGDDAFDLLLTPTLAGPPPRLGELSGRGGNEAMMNLWQYSAQFNITGQPAINLPLHQSADGLPIGVQLVAASYREDLLVRVAAQLEAASPWTAIAPM